MEGVLAAFAQFDNDCRSDRTRAGMKAALELGRWVFLAPIGYLNAPRAMGKSLMPDPERAPPLRRAFEEYATGRFTKQRLLKQSRAWGLTNRRGCPLTSQAMGVLLRNQLYAGIVDVTEYGVRGKRGDFEPLISEDLFFRVQAVLSGRVPSTTPQQRADPDFPQPESTQVSLGERDTGTGLQVSLERHRALLVVELDDDVRVPRPPICGVRASAEVMDSKTCEDIRGHAGVVAARVRPASDDVDETLCSRHRAGDCNRTA